MLKESSKSKIIILLIIFLISIILLCFIIKKPNKVEDKKIESSYIFSIEPNGGTYAGIQDNKDIEITNDTEYFLENPTNYEENFEGWNIKVTSNIYDETKGVLALNFKAFYSGKTSIIDKSSNINNIESLYEDEENVIKKINIIIDPVNGTWNNSDKITTVTLKNNDKLSLVNPQKEGYIFSGWRVVSSYDGKDTLINKMIATYKENYQNVTIDLDGGKSNQQLKHKLIKGEKLLLEKPYKEGYTFYKWIVNGGKLEGNNLTVDETNVYVKATWKINEYAIEYVLNGGVANNINSYNVNTTKLRLNSPQKENYKFVGWTFAGNDAPVTEIDIDSKKLRNLTLVANYEPIIYDIILELNNGCSDLINYTVEDEVTLPILTREGYIFEGWYDTEDFANNKVSGISKGTSGNYKFYAKWRKDYTIKLNVNFGLPEEYKLLNYIEGTGTQYIDTGYSDENGFSVKTKFSITKAVGAESIIGSHNLRSPYGRNYIGIDDDATRWNIGTGDVYLSSPEKIENGHIYTIDFSTVLNDSYLVVDNNELIVSNDKKLRSVSNVLIFACQWSLKYNDTLAQMKLYELEMYNKNKELVRNFIPAMNEKGEIGLYDKIENKFYSNAGTDEFIYEESISDLDSTKVVTLGKTYGQLPVPVKEGYEFKGWYTKSDGGEIITSNTIVTNSAENQTLYAKWEKIKTTNENR